MGEAGCPFDDSLRVLGFQMRHTIRVFDKTYKLPDSRRMRIGVGYALIAGGMVGFLPVLGFWMIPLGLYVLSREYHWLRRARRRWVTRKNRRQRAANSRNGE